MSEVTRGWGQEETSAPGRREGRAAGGPPAAGDIFPQGFVFLCFESSQRATHLVIFKCMGPSS